MATFPHKCVGCLSFWKPARRFLGWIATLGRGQEGQQRRQPAIRRSRQAGSGELPASSGNVTTLGDGFGQHARGGRGGGGDDDGEDGDDGNGRRRKTAKSTHEVEATGNDADKENEQAELQNPVSTTGKCSFM